MCDLSIVEIGEDVSNFNCDFMDCNGATGNASFVEVNPDGLYLIEGMATNEQSFSVQQVVPKEAKVNPTKLFKFIADKLKEILCPTCM